MLEEHRSETNGGFFFLIWKKTSPIFPFWEIFYIVRKFWRTPVQMKWGKNDISPLMDHVAKHFSFFKVGSIQNQLLKLALSRE